MKCFFLLHSNGRKLPPNEKKVQCAGQTRVHLHATQTESTRLMLHSHGKAEGIIVDRRMMVKVIRGQKRAPSMSTVDGNALQTT